MPHMGNREKREPGALSANFLRRLFVTGQHERFSMAGQRFAVFAWIWICIAARQKMQFLELMIRG